MTPLLTLEEAAELIARTPKAVQQLVHRGEIPHIKHGRTIRFETEQLAAWVTAHRVRPNR